MITRQFNIKNKFKNPLVEYISKSIEIAFQTKKVLISENDMTLTISCDSNSQFQDHEIEKYINEKVSRTALQEYEITEIT